MFVLAMVSKCFNPEAVWIGEECGIFTFSSNPTDRSTSSHAFIRFAFPLGTSLDTPDRAAWSIISSV